MDAPAIGAVDLGEDPVLAEFGAQTSRRRNAEIQPVLQEGIDDPRPGSDLDDDLDRRVLLVEGGDRLIDDIRHQVADDAEAHMALQLCAQPGQFGWQFAELVYDPEAGFRYELSVLG